MHLPHDVELDESHEDGLGGVHSPPLPGAPLPEVHPQPAVQPPPELPPGQRRQHLRPRHPTQDQSKSNQQVSRAWVLPRNANRRVPPLPHWKSGVYVQRMQLPASELLP